MHCARTAGGLPASAIGDAHRETDFNASSGDSCRFVEVYGCHLRHCHLHSRLFHMKHSPLIVLALVRLEAEAGGRRLIATTPFPFWERP